MRIWREYTFEAAHQLPNVPKGHKCGRIHGHSYKVEVHVSGPVVDGWVMDFAEVDAVAKPLIAEFDHQFLNDFMRNPTSENVAIYLWQEIAVTGLPLVRVVVRETERSGCEYEGES